MWVKICGIRDVQTARQAAESGASAVGLNFYTGTVRHVAANQAAEIVKSLDDSVRPVGLFVDQSVDEILELCSLTGIQTIQLHNDHTLEFVAELRKLDASKELIYVYRLGSAGFRPLANFMQQAAASEIRPDYCLIDAHRDDAPGGTGDTVPWNLVRSDYDTDNWPPLILAGGLKPANVAEAVSTVHPWGVDVASGVEDAPGKKSRELIGAFIRNARDAANTDQQ